MIERSVKKNVYLNVVTKRNVSFQYNVQTTTNLIMIILRFEQTNNQQKNTPNTL